MATLDQLSAALVKADAAGNVEDARAFANEIRRLRSTETAPAQVTQPNGIPGQRKEPTTAEKIMGSAPVRFALGAAEPLVGAFQLGANVGDVISEKLGNEPFVGQGVRDWWKQVQEMKRAGMAPDALDIAGGVGNVAMGLGGGAIPATVKGKIAQGAATGAAYGAAQPGATASENVSNAATGAVAGAVAPFVIPAAAKAAGWIWDAAGGKLVQVNAGKIMRTIAGPELDKIRALASAAPANLTAAQATAPANRDMLAAMGERAAKRDVTNYFSDIARSQESGRQNALAAVTPDLNAAVFARAAASQPLYAAATKGTTPVDTSGLVQQVTGLLEKNPGNPELVAALGRVKTGLEASTNAEQVSSVLDGLKTAIASKDNKFIVKNLADVKNTIESALPGYMTAQKVFAAGSKAVNQATLLNEMQSVAARPGGGERVTPFLNALGRGEESLIKRTTGQPRFTGIEEVLTPKQLGVVEDIASQYTRDLQLAANAAKGKGGLGVVLGETKSNVELPPSIGFVTRFTNKFLSLVEGKVNSETQKALENGMRSGKDLTALIDTLPTVERNKVLKFMATSPTLRKVSTVGAVNALAPSSTNQNAMTEQ